VVAIFRCESQHASAIGQSQAFALFGVIALHHHHHRSLLFEVPAGFISAIPYPAFFAGLFISSSVPPMTIAVLRSLHAIIGSAIDDIERVYASSDHANSEESTSRLYRKAHLLRHALQITKQRYPKPDIKHHNQTHKPMLLRRHRLRW
jgi:hypothetical protein